MFELIDAVEAITEKDSNSGATSILRATKENDYILCTNAGDDSITVFARDKKTGN